MLKVIKNISIYTLLGVLFSFTIQEALNWNVLEYSVETDFVFNTKYGTWVEAPIFSPSIQKYDGKSIVVKGYIIPGNAYEGKYYISKNPNATCYFCTKSGVGTMIELDLKTHQEFNVDDFVTIKGVLHLDDDPTQMPYQLKLAEVVK